LFKAREVAQPGNNKCKPRCFGSGKTAKLAIAQGKRLTAGLHVAAGKFCIEPDCFKTNEIKEERKKRRSIRLQSRRRRNMIN
jgi:hypothetical protein